MAKIFWFASYPKSGNTWIRTFLTNYLRNAVEPADINMLEGGPIAAARSWFDEWSGIEASALDDGMIGILRPGVYRFMANEVKEPLYMKVHDSWCRTMQGEGLFPADITAGVVYVLRNPLDMAASCANHWGVSIAQAVDNLCDADFALARGGMGDQLRQHLGSWTGHVRSWLDESGLPVHLVRYEDLRSDPEAFFGKLVQFCNLPFDPDRLRRAVTFSDFRELQRQERDRGFRERSVVAHGAFFRRGMAGTWRDELPDTLAARLIAVHGEMMRRFGYLDEQNMPK